jgi:hypothetical protein
VCAAQKPDNDEKRKVKVARNVKQPDGSFKQVVEEVEVINPASAASVTRGPQPGARYNYNVNGRIVEASSWEEAYKLAGLQPNVVPVTRPQFTPQSFQPQVFQGYGGFGGQYSGGSCGPGG